jgi:Protein of unknwon function (DUF3310)
MRKCAECGSTIMHLEDKPREVAGCRPQESQVTTTGHSHNDPVNHPSHYNRHPSGVECIDIVEHMTFNVGNAIKYLWRLGLKSEDAGEDLAKAIWYLERERELLKKKNP